MSKPMFEQFTEKAIKVVMLAQQEARRLGHNFVGTENILLGLIAEGTGVAAQVLKSMEIRLQQTRIEVEAIIGRGSGFVAEEIPYTPRATRVLCELARDESRQLGHNYIGTEHLLLALIREGEGVGVQVLENRGVDLSEVRTQVLHLESNRSAGLQVSPSEADRRLARQVIEELATPDSRFAEPQAAAVAARFCAALYQWVEPRRLGEVLCSPSLRLMLSDDDYLILTPQVAFVSSGELQKPASRPLIPELAAMVLSGSGAATKRMGLEILMEYGVQVGLLLDLETRTVTVYGEAGAPRILVERETLTIEELFPGWEVPVLRFWPPVESG